MCDESVKVKHVLVLVFFFCVGAFFAVPALMEDGTVPSSNVPVAKLNQRQVANRDNFLDLLSTKKKLKDMKDKLSFRTLANPNARAAPEAVANSAGGIAMGHEDSRSKGHEHKDVEGRPQLFKLVSRLNTALSKFFGGKHKKKSTCFKGWKSPHPDSFLAGCAAGCKRFNGLEEAKVGCQNAGSECGGVIFSNGGYELRGASEPEHSPAGEISYVKILCDDQASALNVWKTFHDTMETNLDDASLNLDANQAYFQAHDQDKHRMHTDDSIFLSVASYRDPNCGPTVRRAFENAEQPNLVIRV